MGRRSANYPPELRERAVRMVAEVWSDYPSDWPAICAVAAKLGDALELGAQAVGKQSWLTGGTTDPWLLHEWADVRVDPTRIRTGVISTLQDAQALHRWRSLGDDYSVPAV